VAGQDAGCIARDRAYIAKVVNSYTNKRMKNFREEMQELSSNSATFFEQGTQQFFSENFKDAIACFDKILKLKPNDYETWFVRGVALEKLYKFEEALNSYRNALKINSIYDRAWQGCGNVLIFLEQYEDAIISFDKAIEFGSNDGQTWSNRGSALAILERYEESIFSYNTALKLDPDDPSTWNNRGTALVNSENLEEAIASFDKAVEIQPSFHEAWSARGNAFLQLELYREALASFDKAVKLEPENYEAWSNHGIALTNLQRYKEAIHSFDKAIEIKSNYLAAWNGRGLVLLKSGNLEYAIASFDKAIEFKPNCFEVWQNRGDVLASLERYEEAIDSFDNVLKLKMDFNEAWTHRGTALANLNRYEEAIDSFDQAIKLKPDDEIAWNNRGQAFFELKNYEEAMGSFDIAIKFKPENYEAWSNRGNVLAKLEHLEKAVECFDKAINLNPDDKFTWNNRGVALVKLGSYEEAILSFETVIRLKPDDYEAWSNRGEALARIECFRDAIDSFNKSIQLKSDFCESWINRGLTLIRSQNFNEAISNYKQGLIHVLRENQPDGWGKLHHFIGLTYFCQARLSQNVQTSSLKYFQSLGCYENALQTLEFFPTQYLELIQSLIKTYLGLADSNTANQWRVKGLEVFRQLINAQPTPLVKQRLEAQFSGFSQVAIDVLISTGNLTVALESAERYKNRCLAWLLDEWKETIISPSHATIQSLCAPDTAIVYWHLSPDSLATFILIDGSKTPEILPSNRTTQAQQLTIWLQNWHKDYRDYASKKLTQTESENHPWRQNLQNRLTRLKEILQIETICQNLPDTIQNLILIPHRDLHLLPLHTFFPDHLSCTYLPSAQVGLTLQKQPSLPQTYAPLLSVEDPKTGQDPMPFAQLESAIIRHLVKPSTPIGREQATTATVLHNLQQPFATLHFTGHSAYNARNPKASALALADDLLTAEIIAQQDLSSYRLIILSACETALTGNDDIRTEYVGLASAFLKAGATNVLSTLWPVDEISSTWLMIRFYQFLLTGDTPSIALRQAQRWLQTVTWQQLADWIVQLSQLPNLDRGYIDILTPRAKNTLKEGTIMGLDKPTKYSHPYYWAAFTMTGQG
jgi:tetratricopeptide (TPR) repeat protein/CHAT domain-containing protein